MPLTTDQRTIGGLLISHETAFDKPASLGQLKEIVATLVQTVPGGLSSFEAQRLIENKGWLFDEVQDLFTLRVAGKSVLGMSTDLPATLDTQIRLCCSGSLSICDSI